ncbi:hypothetical protein EJ02DRAFT_469556 [Clathrospora elynae]|uniref:Tachykinin family protein n=1 Tax=Clathrospora elynae TaxID=706981 RepID=A0A6A5SD57_9PLEO|nr:hypothetical protein EJ02DRAFT_469556 [Clathrospora elynae]
MASSSNQKQPFKRRPGRRRLPPLAQGPAFQFVVASHPDEFKDGETMRNVRSHVMYKHREQRESSPRDSIRSREGSSVTVSTTCTPSPMATNTNGMLDDTYLAPTPARHHGTVWSQDTYRFDTPSPSESPTRALAARILSATTTATARSAPPMFREPSEYTFPARNVSEHQSLEDLKCDWIHNTAFFCHDSSWMQYICDNRLSFLSHVYATLVYQDLGEGLLHDSDLTAYAKTTIMRSISDRLDTDDVTIISILHLLISEIGGLDEDVFNVHQDGLATCMRNLRGGILSQNVSKFMTLVMLTFAISRGQDESLELTPRRSSPVLPDDGIPISPLSAPIEDMSRLYGHCSTRTMELTGDMQRCTSIFLARWSHTGTAESTLSGQLATCDAQLQQTYIRLLSLPSTEDDLSPNWIYESCRLAALIYCRSIIHGAAFADSAATMHARNAGPNTESSTLLAALYEALNKTDTQGCWGTPLRGIFLWVCLVGSAASWSSARPSNDDEETSQASAWMRKCFALYAVRAAVSVPFELADATIHALRTMLQVRRGMAAKKGLEEIGQ